jgi:hypothetical protein
MSAEGHAHVAQRFLSRRGEIGRCPRGSRGIFLISIGGWPSGVAAFYAQIAPVMAGSHDRQ